MRTERHDCRAHRFCRPGTAHVICILLPPTVPSSIQNDRRAHRSARQVPAATIRPSLDLSLLPDDAYAFVAGVLPVCRFERRGGGVFTCSATFFLRFELRGAACVRSKSTSGWMPP